MRASDSLYVATRAVLIGAAFIVTVFAILAFGKHEPLSTSDVIALLTGAVTAVGLSAIFLQIQTNEKQRALEMTVRADQLHTEFNAESMRESRDLAYTYLKSLGDRDLRVLAENWIYDRSDPSSPEGKSVWAVDAMVAFFVRLASHVKFYDDRVKHLSAEDLARLIGPFFWNYWAEAGLRALVRECENLEAMKPSPFGRPYFINPLRELEQFSERAKGIKPAAQPEGLEQQQGERLGLDRV